MNYQSTLLFSFWPQHVSLDRSKGGKETEKEIAYLKEHLSIKGIDPCTTNSSMTFPFPSQPIL